MKRISKLPGLYRITNLINRRIYVGSAVNLNRRRITHLNCLRANRHRNTFLQRDYNKLGESAFLFEVIEYCNVEMLINGEQKLLDQFYDNQNKCYNICKVSQVTTGRKHTEETKNKIKKALIGRDAWWAKNKTPSSATKQLLSLANDKTKKQVVQFAKDKNEIIATYQSISEASRNTGIDVKSISAACHKRSKTAGGFVWKFLNYVPQDWNETVVKGT